MGFSRQEYWSGVPLPSLRKPIYIYIYTEIHNLNNVVKNEIAYLSYIIFINHHRKMYDGILLLFVFYLCSETV